ncbi:Cut9-interacting protein scn1 [Diatrype stigma]|uniref:Cut9-interacting protein scn1 n=1 Tax=Diatrype stigma TaxID=117547 RepID=A0AAN9YS25_9PEZI
MASLSSIQHMKARALTVMSTRSQDQQLVSDIAARQGVQDLNTLKSPQSSSENRVVPCFGWHPWFSHQLYDDTVPKPTYDGTESGKTAHYDAILAPSPSSKDPSFIAGLPSPRPLSEFLNETRSRLKKHPLALVGEIGIDRAFRLPGSWTADDEAQRDEGLTPGGREGRKLSPYRVQLSHQAAILQAQLRLAGEMGRAVSVHGVQAHGALHEAIAQCWKGHERPVNSRRQQKRVAEGAEDFSSSSSSSSEDEAEEEEGRKEKVAKSKKPYPPRICLHSFSGPVEALRQYVHPAVPAQVFFSFSVPVNWGTGGGDKAEEAVRAAPDDRILVESDLHEAGEPMDRSLEQVCRKICEVKGWGLREGVERLARNWREFAFGRGR